MKQRFTFCVALHQLSYLFYILGCFLSPVLFNSIGLLIFIRPCNCVQFFVFLDFPKNYLRVNIDVSSVLYVFLSLFVLFIYLFICICFFNDAFSSLACIEWDDSTFNELETIWKEAVLA
jgi:hypothetical protein